MKPATAKWLYRWCERAMSRPAEARADTRPVTRTELLTILDDLEDTMQAVVRHQQPKSGTDRMRAIEAVHRWRERTRAQLTSE